MDILEAADRMCYVAKETGRNRIASEELRGYPPRKSRPGRDSATQRLS